LRTACATIPAVVPLDGGIRRPAAFKILPALYRGRQFGKESTNMDYRKYRTTLKDELKNPDYSYIRKDLRRIALIASSFIVVLIALSFFIH
jgi:hypothetical protein